jgi:glutamate/tyrosine decarboxylase-like PLP-dependent enzyme
MQPSDVPPLSLRPDEFRRLGHRVIEVIADHLEHVAERPPITVGTPDELRARLDEPAPESPTPPDAVLDQVLRDVLPFVQHGDHPRFFARIGSPGNPIGVLADALAVGHNAFVGSWTGGSGPATIELVTLEWLRELFGLPEGTEGAFVSGGSVASLTAIAAARAVVLGGHDPRATVYLSDQAHASIARALRILGCAPGQIRTLESDAELRMPVAALRDAITRDRAAGARPFCVIATAGSTNTGAVDPLEAIADVCAHEGLWLHADAAYGGPAVLSEAGRRVLQGLERVDSLAVDPHKWLFQPYEIGCVLVRRPGALEAAFALHPEYLADVSGVPGEVNFFDRGVQLTRGFRALKLWMTIKVYGLAAVRDAVAHGIALAEHAERVLRDGRGWDVVTPAQLGIVSFRPVLDQLEDEPAVVAALVAGMTADGYAAVSSTTLKGRSVLRLCTINPRTTFDDITRTIDRLDRVAVRLNRAWHNA